MVDQNRKKIPKKEKKRYTNLSKIAAILTITQLLFKQTDQAKNEASYKVNGKKFSKLSSRELESSNFAIATTSDFKVYKITSESSKTKQYSISGLSPIKVRGAVYINSEYVLLLNEKSKNKMHYYLAKDDSTTSQAKLTIDTKTGSTAQMNWRWIRACNIWTHAILGGNDRMILMFNGPIEMLRFDASTNTLSNYGANGRLPQKDGRRDYQDGFVINEGNKYVLVTRVRDTAQPSPHRDRLESYVFEASGSKHETISTTFVFGTAYGSYSKLLLVKPHPMRVNPLFTWTARFTKFIIAYYGIDKRVGFLEMKMDGKFFNNYFMSLANDLHIVTDIGGPPGTNYIFAIGMNKNWNFKSGWGTDVSKMVVFQHKAKSIADSDYLKKLVSIQISENFPLGNKIALFADGSGLTTGNFSHVNNVVFLKDALNLGCQDTQRVTEDWQNPGTYYCYNIPGLSPYCLDPEPFSSSCSQCWNTLDNGISFSLVGGYDYMRSPFKKVCQPSTVVCQWWGYLTLNSNFCYDCQWNLQGCSTCWNHVEGCRTCFSGWALKEHEGVGQYRCEACNTIHAECATCEQKARYTSLKCLSCTAGWTLIDDTTCVESCSTAGNPECADGGCSGGDPTCSSCNGNYEFVDSANDRFCRKTCPAGHYWKGKQNNVCESCKTPSDNGECTACDDLTGVCTSCASGYSPVSITDSFCGKDCAINEYWTGRGTNDCASCAPSTNTECKTCDDVTGTCNACNSGFKHVSSLDKFCRKNCNNKQYWKGENDNVCATCAPTTNPKCERCDDLTGTCNRCYNNYEYISLDDRFCRRTCTDTQYWRGRTQNDCQNCVDLNNNQDCLTCQDETGKCLTCKTGSAVISDTDSFCKKTCETNQYWTGKSANTCSACAVTANPKCGTCEDETGNCKTCLLGYRFISSTDKFCRKDCPVGFYWTGKTTNTCETCAKSDNPQCKACHDLTGVCTACNPQHDHVSPTDKFCKMQCDETQYWTGRSVNTCPTCASVSSYGEGCKSCTDDTSGCSVCKDYYQFVSSSDKFCKRQCTSNEYWTGRTENTCPKCFSVAAYGACGSCNDDTSGCNGCLPDHSFISSTDKFCKKDCPADHYWTGKTTNTCESCSKPDNLQCKECDLNTSECTACKPGYEFTTSVDKFCRKTCEVGLRWTGKETNICELVDTCPPKDNPKCKKCTKNNTDCEECEEEYEKLSETDSFCKRVCKLGQDWTGRETNTCETTRTSLLKICPPILNQKCETCDPSTGGCLTCKAGYKAISETDEFCKIECAKGEFWKGRNANICSKCTTVDPECLECEDTTGACTTCGSAFNLVGGRCKFSHCPKNKYRRNSRATKCHLCSTKIENCEECDEFGDKCTKCKEGFMPEKAGTTCSTAVVGNLKKSFSYFAQEQSGVLSLVYNEMIEAEHLDRLIFILIEKNKIRKVSDILKSTTTNDNAQNRRRLEGGRILQQLVDEKTKTSTYDLKVKNIGIGKKRIKADLEMPYKDIYGAEIEVTSVDSRDIRRKSGGTGDAFDSSFPVIIKDVEYTESIDRPLFEMAGVCINLALAVLIVVLACVSLPMMALASQVYQFAFLLKLYTVKHTGNMSAFLLPFGTYLNKQTASVFEFDEGASDCIPGQVFFQCEVSCLSGNGLRWHWMLWLAILVIKLILTLLIYIVGKMVIPEGKTLLKIRRRSKKRRTCGQKFLVLLADSRDYFSTRFFFYLALAWQMDVLIRAFVGVRYGSFSGGVSLANFMIGVLVILAHLVLIVMTSRETYKMYHEGGNTDFKPVQFYEQKKRANVRRRTYGSRVLNTQIESERVGMMNKSGSKDPFSGPKQRFLEPIYLGFSEDDPLGYLIIPLYMLMNVIASAIMVFVQVPILQVVAIIVSVAAIPVIILLCKPYRKTYQTIGLGGVVLCSMVVLTQLAILLLALNDPQKLLLDMVEISRVVEYSVLILVILATIAMIGASFVLAVEVFQAWKLRKEIEEEDLEDQDDSDEEEQENQAEVKNKEPEVGVSKKVDALGKDEDNGDVASRKTTKLKTLGIKNKPHQKNKMSVFIRKGMKMNLLAAGSGHKPKKNSISISKVSKIEPKKEIPIRKELPEVKKDFPVVGIRDEKKKTSVQVGNFIMTGHVKDKIPDENPGMQDSLMVPEPDFGWKRKASSHKYPKMKKRRDSSMMRSLKDHHKKKHRKDKKDKKDRKDRKHKTHKHHKEHRDHHHKKHKKDRRERNEKRDYTDPAEVSQQQPRVPTRENDVRKNRTWVDASQDDWDWLMN